MIRPQLLMDGLRPWATSISRLYGAPVYLVGSALEKAKPRDVDVRVFLDHAEFRRRFGEVERWIQEGKSGEWGDTRHRWSAECVVRSREAWAATGLNVDFQIYPKGYAVPARREKLAPVAAAVRKEAPCTTR